MTAKPLRDRLTGYLPTLEETSRLIDLALHRLPPEVTGITEEPSLSKAAEAVGEYLGALWQDSLPEISRDIAVRLAPLTPLQTPNPSPSELEDALDSAEEIVNTLSPGIRRNGCVRDIALLRQKWEPIRGASLERTLSELLPPQMRRTARQEALRRCVHRMSLPLKMLSQELPGYLRFITTAGHPWPASSLGWRAEEGRWEPPNWKRLEELNDLLSREPTVERLARTVAVAPARRAEAAASKGTSRAPAPPEEGRWPRELSLLHRHRVAGTMDPEERFLLRRRGRARQISLGVIEELKSSREDSSENANARADAAEARSQTAPPPVALVLDTTGSMKGEGESVAGALAAGLLRHAVARGRKLILLVFSTAVRRLLLTPDAPSVSELPGFLDNAFGSGAAAVPALRDVLRQAQRENWSEADILFVTDSREARLSPTTEEQLGELRRRSSLRLHGLTINKNPMINSGNLFDFTWHYASSWTLRPGISSEQFRQS